MTTYPLRTWSDDQGRPLSPAAQYQAELEHIHAWLYEAMHPAGKDWEDLKPATRARFRARFDEAELWRLWTTDRPRLHALATAGRAA